MEGDGVAGVDAENEAGEDFGRDCGESRKECQCKGKEEGTILIFGRVQQFATDGSVKFRRSSEFSPKVLSDEIECFLLRGFKEKCREVFRLDGLFNLFHLSMCEKAEQ